MGIMDHSNGRFTDVKIPVLSSRPSSENSEPTPRCSDFVGEHTTIDLIALTEHDRTTIGF